MPKTQINENEHGRRRRRWRTLPGEKQHTHPHTPTSHEVVYRNHTPLIIPFSLNVDQLNIEDQGRIGRDDAARPAVAVRVVGRAGQLGALALGQLGKALIPRLDDLAHADREAEGVVAVAGRVELLAVRQGAGVVGDDGLDGRESTRVCEVGNGPPGLLSRVSRSTLFPAPANKNSRPATPSL